MKHLYMIGGTMGIGKTTVSQILKKKLPNCVFLDGDWCWDMSPFQVTEATKKVVVDNICYMLNNFLKCPDYENVIFCWVMHEQAILDNLLSRIDTEGVDVKCISLICDAENLRSRLQGDIDRGIRHGDVIERSVPRLALYEKLDTSKIDVSGATPELTAEKIASGRF